MESINSIPYAGKTITFSFYARAGANYSAASNILSVNVSSGTGTDQNINTSFTGIATVITQNATLTTTWQRFSYTGTVSSAATQLGFYVNWTPVGTAGANDYFEITGVQLEAAASATAYSPNTSTYALELAACQRYYTRAVSGASYGRLSVSTPAASSGTIYVSTPLPVRMRVAPTSVDYSTLAFYDGVTVTAISSVSIDAGTSTDYASLNCGSSSLTQYRPYFIVGNASASAYLGLSAEL
jgi:hypothetical protein